MDDILSKTVSFLGSEEGESPHYDNVVLQMSADGKLQATRSQQDREKNPDRISLDRRGLTKLPQLMGEPRLRLLSLQHNLVTRIDNISGLGLSRLVFLDIYDNQLERISGLETLENLRVLLMGKNRIRRVEGLSNLTKLEVLDLHGNQIHQVTGLCAQGELKVLNLAGNQIRTIGTSDLHGLQSLLELNLRRNRLKRLLCFGETPQLQKLFLSNNELQSVDCMSSVTKATNLMEVAIDGNPLALGGDCVSFLVSFLPKLKLLSNLEVSEAVRKAALSWRSGRERSGSPSCPKNGESFLDIRREEVISNARTNWELLRSQTCGSLKDLRSEPDYESSAERCVQSDSGISVTDSITYSHRKNDPDPFDFFKLPPILGGTEEKAAEVESEDAGVVRCDSLSSVEPNVDSSLSSLPSDTSSSDLDSSEDLASPQEAATHAEEPSRRVTRGMSQCKKHAGRRAQPRACTGRVKQKMSGLPGRVREQGGDFLVEICGRCLNVYGQGALRFIDRPWNSGKAAEVSTIKFTYISYNSIISIFGRLKLRFPNVEHFIFQDTNIHCLGQLNALADIQGLTSLQVDREGNPVTQKDWQKYAIYRLYHWGLRVVNGKEVTEEDVTAASEEFKGLSDIVLWSLPDTLLQPLLSRLHLDGNRSVTQNLTAKQWLWSADPALRSVVGKEALQWRRGSLTQEDVLWRHKGRVHLAYLLELAISAIEKLHLLEVEWPDILAELVRDTLVDYSHLDSYMKKCIQSLKI